MNYLLCMYVCVYIYFKTRFLAATYLLEGIVQRRATKKINRIILVNK